MARYIHHSRYITKPAATVEASQEAQSSGYRVLGVIETLPERGGWRVVLDVERPPADGWETVAEEGWSA